MLSYALAFAVLAIIAGVLGFGALGGTMALIAKVCLLLFVIMFVIALVTGRRGGAAV